MSAAVTLCEWPRPDGGRDPEAVVLTMSGIERVLRSFLGVALGIGRVAAAAALPLLNIEGLRRVWALMRDRRFVRPPEGGSRGRTSGTAEERA